MSRIVIILLLSTGAFCLLDQDKDGEVLTPEVKPEIPVSSEPLVENEKHSSNLPDKKEIPIQPPKKAPVMLDKDMINQLAEKVIRIHGVDLESSDDENLNNIAQLKNLVSNVEKDLNAKLKLSQEKKKLNLLNKEHEVQGSIAPAPSDSFVEQNKEDVPQNQIGENANDEENIKTIIESNENGEAVDNIGENVKKVSENKSDNDDKLKNEADEVTTNKNENPHTETESNTIISEAPTVQQETRNKNIETDNKKNDIIPDEAVNDVKPEFESSINENEDKVSDKDTEESEEPTRKDPIDEENIDKTENENQTKEDYTENEGDETETREANGDVTETVNAEEETGDTEEDEIIGTCSLGEDCDRTDNTHQYSQEYNTEENLENIITDSYLQSIIKYVTSILN